MLIERTSCGAQFGNPIFSSEADCADVEDLDRAHVNNNGEALFVRGLLDAMDQSSEAAEPMSDELAANTAEFVGRWPLPSEVAYFNQFNADIQREIAEELMQHAVVRHRLAWELRGGTCG